MTDHKAINIGLKITSSTTYAIINTATHKLKTNDEINYAHVYAGSITCLFIKIALKKIDIKRTYYYCIKFLSNTPIPPGKKDKIPMIVSLML